MEATRARRRVLLFSALTALPVPVAAPLSAQARVDGWRVRGRLLDLEGRPITDGVVASGGADTICTQDALRAPVARTGADGRFAFDLSVSWTGIARPAILLTAPGRAAMLWTLTANAGAQLMDVGEVRLPAGGVLKGRVRLPDGRPLAGARVTATDLIALRLATADATPDDRGLVSCGTSDEDGAFALPGIVPDCLQVRVAAEGYFTRVLAPVSVGEPLVVRLAPSGQVAGRVVGRRTVAGEPPPVAAARVSVSYEVGGEPDHCVLTGADGAFSTGLRQPGRYVLHAWREGAGEHAHSDVLESAQRGVVLTIDADAPDAETAAPAVVVLRPVDAATGQPIARCRAGLMFGKDLDEATTEARINTRLCGPDADGLVRLPLDAGARNGGIVCVLADGHAPGFRRVTAADAGSAPLDVVLAAQAAITGRVIDGKTRAPVANAEIQCFRVRDDGSSPAAGRPRFTGTITDRDGRYRLEQLGRSTYELIPTLRGRAGAAVRVDLARERAGDDVTLELPHGATLAGTIRGLPADRRWEVEIVPALSAWRGPERGDSLALDRVPVAADGTFRHDQLDAGDHVVRLVLTDLNRAGSFFAIELASIRLENGDNDVKIDAAPRVPVTFRGRIALRGGLPIPRGRLAVVAREILDHPDPRGTSAKTRNPLFGRRCLVAPDGGFELTSSRRRHALQVVDILTGLVLYREDEIDPPARGPVVRDLVLDVVAVRVQLEPADGGTWNATWLDIGARDPQLPDPVTIGGLDVAHRPDQLMLFVPPGETVLMLRAGRARPGMPEGELVRATISARAADPQVVTLRIGTPASAPDSRPR